MRRLSILVLALWPAVLPAAGRAEAETAVRTLPNGLTIVHQRLTTSAITSVDILVKGGRAAEPAALAGLSYLTTRLAIDVPDQRKAQIYMVQAVRLNMTARPDAAVIHLECLTEFFPEVLDAFVRILSDPLFTGIRIDRIKEQMGHQRRMESDDAAQVGRTAQLQGLFKGTGYAGSMYGTEESLKAIKARDIRDFYDARFTAGNMILAAVSDLPPERLMEILEKAFGGFRRGVAPPAPVFAASAPPAAPAEIEKDVLQTYVSAAFPLPPPSRRSFALGWLVENALGRGPGTRLWGLRSEGRLAYNVGCAASAMKNGGLLEAYLETDPAKTAAARAALAESLKSFAESGLTAEEFETARTGLRALFLRGNETKSERAGTLGTFELMGMGAGFFDEFAAELGRITREEANAFIRERLRPEAASWVVVGPKTK